MSEPRRIDVSRCELCPFEIYEEERHRRWCGRHAEMRDTPDIGVPAWCPLRPANGGPVLVVLREEAGR